MESPLRMCRLVRLEEAGRDFDVEFWQKQGDAAIFEAAWELVVLAETTRKPDADLRLQRSVCVLKRR